MTKHRKLSAIEQDISQVEAELAALQRTIDKQQHTTHWQQLVELTTQQGTAATRLESLMHEWEQAMRAEEGREDAPS